MSDQKQPSPYSETDRPRPVVELGPGDVLPGAYLPHCRAMELRGDELHWDKGWYFSRMKDGWVHIRLKWGCAEADAMIHPDEWAAILDHVRTPDQAIAEICRNSGCMEINRGE